MKQKIRRDIQNHQETTKPESAIADTSADRRKVSDLIDQQKNALRNVDSRVGTETAPGLKVSQGDDGFSIAIDHPDQQIGRQLLMDAMGTENVHFCNGLLPQLVDAGSTNLVSQTQTNFMLAVITSSNPDKQFEVMCKALMAASFNAAMDCHSKALRAFSPSQLDSASS